MAMHHAGAGVMTMRVFGSVAVTCTTERIQVKHQSLRFARACAIGGSHVNTNWAPARSIVQPTTGTMHKLARIAYGENCRKMAAVSGHVPSCVAIASAIASCIRSGNAHRDSSQCAIGVAAIIIALTHENESKNDAPVTWIGRSNAKNNAAAASAFHDNAFRPHARPMSANESIVAARIAGSCAPAKIAYTHAHTIVAMHVAMRGARIVSKNHKRSATTTPRCNPAVTRMCTVPVS